MTMNQIQTQAVELVCKKHGKYMGEITSIGNKIIHQTWCPVCKAEFDNSPEQLAKLAEEKRIEEMKAAQRSAAQMGAVFVHARIPEEFHGKLLDTVQPLNAELTEALRQARLYVDNFDRVKAKGVGFCFYGHCGVGKTMIACAILQELMPAVQGLYAPIWDVIKACKEADRFGGDVKPLERLQKAPLLVIDELGARGSAPLEESLLMTVIDVRVSHRLPTIYVSNLLPDVREGQEKPSSGLLKEKLGARLFNRMCGSSVFLRIRGESQRKRIKSIDEVLEV